jgi:hypothetical protein
MENTVTTRPEYGTLEYFADRLRGWTERADFNSALIGIVESAASPELATDAEAVGYVRNALAAAELVRAEQAADR